MSTLSSYPGQTDRVALTDLVRELFSKVGEIVNTQLQLTKTEIKVESRKMVGAVAFAGISLLLGSFFILFFGICLTLALWQVVNLVWASAITTIVYLLLTCITLICMFRELHKNSGNMEVE